MSEIFPAREDADFEDARALLREYAELPGVFRCFQRMEEELRELPHRYGPPEGGLLLARRSGRLAGCVAFRKLEADICEMKRLYVRPAHRGSGLGRRLAEGVVDVARAAGYSRMRLDSLGWMDAAHALYRSMGFRKIPPYHDRAKPGEVFMALALAPEDRLAKPLP